MKPEAHLDGDGTPFLIVPISNRPGRFARIDRADYDRLSEGRRSLSLFLCSNGQGREYLCLGTTTRPHTVGRLILNPGPKRTVVYLNGDRTDVRRSNLRAHKKRPGGKRKADPEAQLPERMSGATAHNPQPQP